MENQTAETQGGTGAATGDHVPAGHGTNGAENGGTGPIVSAAETALAYGGNPTGENPPGGTATANLCGCGCGTVCPDGQKYKNESHRKRVVRRKAKAGGTGGAVPEGLPSALDNFPAAGGGVASVPDCGDSPSPAWTEKDIAPLIREVVKLGEELATGQVLKAAAPLALGDKEMEQIKADAAWPDASKNLIAQGAGELAALGLNQAAIPPAYRPGLTLVAGLGQVALSHVQLIKTIRRLVAEKNGGPVQT